MDVSNPARPQVHVYTSAGRPAGVWSRGGLVLGPEGLYGQTADGAYDPVAGKFGNSVMVIGGVDHHTPLYQMHWGNDETRLWGRGVWGSMASWKDSQGQRWLFVPMWGLRRRIRPRSSIHTAQQPKEASWLSDWPSKTTSRR